MIWGLLWDGQPGPFKLLKSAPVSGAQTSKVFILTTASLPTPLFYPSHQFLGGLLGLSLPETLYGPSSSGFTGLPHITPLLKHSSQGYCRLFHSFYLCGVHLSNSKPNFGKPHTIPLPSLLYTVLLLRNYMLGTSLPCEGPPPFCWFLINFLKEFSQPLSFWLKK